MKNDIAEQRQFLHDLSSPLSTAIFIVDMLREDLQALPEAGTLAPSLEQLNSTLEKLRKMIEDRRAALKIGSISDSTS